MIYKYYLSINGDLLKPNEFLANIKGDFVVDNCFHPTDSNPVDIDGEYGYGGISFWHPNKFATKEHIAAYERDFMEFIDNNFKLFIENHMTELQIFIEIYFDGGQCNFEVFSKEMLKKIASFGVSIPISIYVLSEDEIIKWQNEINLTW